MNGASLLRSRLKDYTKNVTVYDKPGIRLKDYAKTLKDFTKTSEGLHQNVIVYDKPGIRLKD